MFIVKRVSGASLHCINFGAATELALGIGKLVGNVTVGAENLVNRVLEIFALSDKCYFTIRSYGIIHRFF